MVISLFVIPDTIPLKEQSQASQLQLCIYVTWSLGRSRLVVALSTWHASFLSFIVFLSNPVQILSTSVGTAPEIKEKPKGTRLSFELWISLAIPGYIGGVSHD